MPVPGSKSLPAAELDAVRAFVRRLVDRDHAGNVAAFSRAVHLSQSQVSNFLIGNHGAGPKFLSAVASYAGVPVDVVLGRSSSPSAPALARHPDWPAARAAAEAAHPEIPASAFDVVGSAVLPLGAPAELDAAFIAGLAREIDALQRRADRRAGHG